jgi:hypothetical protein
MRLARILALSVVLVALVAGGMAIALAGSGSAKAPPTKARATTYARAVNLRASDVHGLIVTGASYAAKGPLGAGGGACGVAVPAGAVVGIYSQTFQRLGASTNASREYTQGVASVVYVMRSAALASRELAAVTAVPGDPTVVTCLKRYVESIRLEEEDERSVTGRKPIGEPIFSDAEVSALRSSAGAMQADGLQIKAHSAVRSPGMKGPFNFYEGCLAFAVGPAVVMLEDTGTPRSFPAVTERRLLALLYRRAKAHKL